MELLHAIGKFNYSDKKISIVEYYDDKRLIALARKLYETPSSDNTTKNIDFGLLKELRNIQYKDKLIHANLLLVKRIIAESVNTDTHIIQAINAIEELDKVCNTLVKRVREWYGYYYPELSRNNSDNELFIKKVLQKTKEEHMLEYNESESMGPVIDEIALSTLLSYARQVDDMYLERQKLTTYIDNTMMSYCPNVYTLTGGIIGAKLLEKARSLKHLAMMPSSTIQLLGAEKALFRHLRNKRIRPPKHGLILSHPFVMGAKRSNKGSAARMFAAKISIAAKIDYFKGEFIGDQLREKLEKKLK
ncbi:MAG: NOP5/NOP56 family protein [Candidatus Woesearchaeota archaeon]